MKIKPPINNVELFARCSIIAGLTVEQLALQLSIEVPTNLQRHKGWLGQLLEAALGCDANNQALPDFTQLGIELKTLPVNNSSQPLESTFICTANPPFATEWSQSHAWSKLKNILWIPILQSEKPLSERIIGKGFLWQPSKEQAKQLEQDWQEIVEMITLGQHAHLSARLGQYLQCRPKAASSNILKKVIDADGNTLQVVPRGFYLRSNFTKQILLENSGLIC